MEALGLLLYGFKVLLTWKILALMMVGLTLGIFVGVLPGLGGPNGVAILLPLTFSMDPTAAIVMLSCIYWGALFGGAITSILFNIPAHRRPRSSDWIGDESEWCETADQTGRHGEHGRAVSGSHAKPNALRAPCRVDVHVGEAPVIDLHRGALILVRASRTPSHRTTRTDTDDEQHEYS